jgi:Flp pilus assembly protein TadG
MMRLRHRFIWHRFASCRFAWRHFAHATHGIAAVEFAMIMPVLAIIFLASFDGGRAIAIYMKVRAATYTVDAIANTYPSINDSQMSGILAATADVLTPYSTAPLGLTVSQIAIDANGKATISWSDTQGGTARAVGSAISVPTNLNVPKTYLVFGEVQYAYQPLFGYFGNHTAITFTDNLYATPRASSSITRTSP